MPDEAIRGESLKLWRSVMRYRIEQLTNDELVVRNVETDVILGLAVPLGVLDPHDPDKWLVTGCRVLDARGNILAVIDTKSVPRPLEMAAVAIATSEEYLGYPGLKAVAKEPNPRRIEFRLGTLLADLASEFARALIECCNGGLKAETKRKCTDLLTQLHGIWYVSRFGSLNAERRAHEPYFANHPTCDARLSFGEAAQTYGMFELRRRYPDASDATLKLGLSWPLDTLESLIKSLMQGETVSETVR
jgi:hypothetical protein